MSGHIPTTLDYAVRVTQRDKPHFAFDIGVGQVAGNIGSIYVANPYSTRRPRVWASGCDHACESAGAAVVGMGLSYRY